MEWDLPYGFTDVRFHVLGLDGRQWEPRQSDSLMVISPFVSDKALSMLADTFDPPDDFNVEKYKEDFLRSMGRHEVRISFDRRLAAWAREQWGSSITDGADGSVILTLFSETMEYPSRLVLGSAPYALPLSPPEFVEKVKQDANAILSLQK